MRSTPVTSADLEQSVIAVSPLARNADLTMNRAANTALIRHIEAGGIASLIYGGNANFHHLPLSEYADTFDFLAEAAGANTWVLPSVGPDHGRSRVGPGWRGSADYPKARRTCRYPKRNAITPAASTPVPTARWRPKGSRSHSVPINAANSTEVSRKAATAATGARVMAHSAMP